MKFATLIALTSVSAIRIQQQAAAEHDPSAADIIEMCDKDDNDKLSKPEVMGCIDKFVKDPKHNKEAKRMVNKHWKAVAGKDNEVSEKELEQAMEDHEELAQKKGKKHHKKGDKSDDDEDSEDDHEHSDDDEKEHRRPKKGDHSDDDDEEEEEHDDKELAQKKGKKGGKKCKGKKDDDSESDSDESSDSDKESDDDHDDKELAQKKGGKKDRKDKELAQRGPPSAEDMAEGLIKHCDGDDQNGMLSKAEVRACGAPKDVADMLFGADGPDKNADGELSKDEIEAFIKKMMKEHGPPSLAQDPVDDFIAHCDKSDDGLLSKKEVIDCGIPKEEVDKHWNKIDTSKDGLVSKREIIAYFSKHH